MIIYNKTKVSECSDDCVGVVGDNLACTQTFYLSGITDSDLSYAIHLRFSDGSVNSITPTDVSTDGDGTLISWLVAKNDIFVHGIFEAQIEATNENGVVFQTEIVRLCADESIVIEDKEFENPNSETLKLREQAYNALAELKAQQQQLDENISKINETTLDKKANVSDVYTKTEADSLLSAKQNTLTIEHSSAIGHVSTVVSSHGVAVGLAGKIDKSEATKQLNLKANASDVYTKTEIEEYLADNFYNIEEAEDTFQADLGSNETYGIQLVTPSSSKPYLRLTNEMLSTINGKLDSSELEVGTATLSPATTAETSAIKMAACTYQKIDSVCYAKITIITNAYTLSANTSLQLSGLPFAQNDTNATLVLGISSAGKLISAKIGAKSATISFTQINGESVTFSEGEQISLFFAYKV